MPYEYALSIRLSTRHVDVHRVAHRCPLQHDASVIAGHGGVELGDWFVSACRDDLDVTGDRVATAHRRDKIPVDIEKHRAGAR